MTVGENGFRARFQIMVPDHGPRDWSQPANYFRPTKVLHNIDANITVFNTVEL